MYFEWRCVRPWNELPPLSKAALVVGLMAFRELFPCREADPSFMHFPENVLFSLEKKIMIQVHGHPREF